MSPNFEGAADAIVNGDVATLVRLLDEEPQLIHQRSTREHRCTLLHYVGANGVEGYRQKTPPNAVELAELLLERGAEVDALTGNNIGVVPRLALLPRAFTHIALAYKSLCLKHFLTAASVDGSPGQWNPLLAALHNDRPESAKFLA